MTLENIQTGSSCARAGPTANALHYTNTKVRLPLTDSSWYQVGGEELVPAGEIMEKSQVQDPLSPKSPIRPVLKKGPTLTSPMPPSTPVSFCDDPSWTNPGSLTRKNGTSDYRLYRLGSSASSVPSSPSPSSPGVCCPPPSRASFNCTNRTVSWRSTTGRFRPIERLSLAIIPCDYPLRLSLAIIPCDYPLRLSLAIIPCDYLGYPTKVTILFSDILADIFLGCPTSGEVCPGPGHTSSPPYHPPTPLVSRSPPSSHWSN
jgi:hypothetical protein